MAVQHLGAISDPLLIFGGPYSNQQATQALLAQAKLRGIPANRVICTGDVVAYCAAPTETTELVRNSGMHVVQGNCEISFGEQAEDCGCGFEEGSTCDRLSVQWFDYARRALAPEAAAWMAALPARITFDMADRRLTVLHGAASLVNLFVFPSTAVADKQAEIDLTDSDGIICGHSGLPFTQTIGDKLWHNAGAIGLPANDGTPRTWFSILTPQAGHIHIEHLALNYDADGAARDMNEAGLPPEYAGALTSGLWDNCDILPDAETRQQGQPLSFDPHIWPRLQEAAE